MVKIKKNLFDAPTIALQGWMVKIGARKVKGKKATKGKRQLSLKVRSNKRKTKRAA